MSHERRADDGLVSIPRHVWDRMVTAPKRSFRDVGILVGESLDDGMRGEVSDMGWAIERANLMHAEFTCDGKRYRVEMREITGSENMEDHDASQD